jgi:hypothetical protein
MPKTIDFRDVRYIPSIKYSGIFHFDGLMKTVRNWIVNQGYEFHEKGLKHKIPSPKGAEQEFEWWGWRKVNSYIKFHVDVWLKFNHLHDVEVVRDGKKEKLQSSTFQIEISGRCELDWSNRFGGSRFLQALADFYDKYITNKDVDTVYTDQLYYRLYKLQQVIKQYLNMETRDSAFEDSW